MRSTVAVCFVIGVGALTALAQQTSSSPTAAPAQKVQAQPAAPTAQPAQSAGITVVREIVCTNVADREPIGAADTFPRSVGTLTCFNELKLDGSGVVQHKWYRSDSLIGNPITLTATGPHFRTYSRKMIPEWASGSWKVEVVDSASGSVLSTKAFEVK